MQRLNWLWLILLAFLLVGCASTSSTSTVNADGTWTRTLKLTVRDVPSFGDDQKEAKADIFSIPAGAEWNKSEKQGNGDTTTTLTRKFSAGEDPITDIVIKNKKGTKYKNFVVVRKLDGNRLEYYEKIVLVGDPPKRDESEQKSFEKDLREVLPAGKATEDEIKQISQRTETALVRLIFGPDDHLFGMMIMNLDGAIRRLRNKIGATETRILSEVLGNKLTQEERDGVVKGLLAKFDTQSVGQDTIPSPAGDPDSKDDQAQFIGMSAMVKLPGKVVETNGEIDEYTGEVYWDLTSNSADAGIVELRAVCQLP